MTLATSDQRKLSIDGLSDRQQLALLHRILHRIGYSDGLGGGHISMRLDDERILITAREFGWDEIRASDLVLMDQNGEQLEGNLQVSNAARSLHSVVHQMRSDVKVAVHNHSRWGTVWAAAGRIPPVYDQFGALCTDDLVVTGDYREDVSNREEAIKGVSGMEGVTKALLRNHGVLVFGQNVRQAHLRAASLEHRCKLAWHVEALGEAIARVDSEVVDLMAGKTDTPNGVRFHFEYAARREVRHDSSVLD